MNIDQIKKHSHNFVLNRMDYYEQDEIFKGYATIFILFLLTVFGALAILPSVFSSINEGKWLTLLGLLGSYSTIPFLLFKKNLSYSIRSKLLCSAVFICGVVVMVNAPLVSSARIWFLCATVLSCLLIGSSSSFIFFCLSFFALLWEGYNANFLLQLPIEPPQTIWIITLSTFVLVNIIVVSSSYFIMLGFFKAENELKRSKKFKTNLKLIQQIEEIDFLINKIAHDYDETLNIILEQSDLALLETNGNSNLINNLKEIQKRNKNASEISKQLLYLLPKKEI